MERFIQMPAALSRGAAKLVARLQNSHLDLITRGLFLGLIGVGYCGLTLVAMWLAVDRDLSPLFIAAERGFSVVFLAVPMLRLTRSPWPTWVCRLRPSTVPRRNAKHCKASVPFSVKEA